MKQSFYRLASVAALCASAFMAGAQNTNSGDIRGTVTDPSGAVIPGVTVTVVDIDKQVTRTFHTDGAGLYDTSQIVPDHYKLTFAKDGFTTLVRGPINVDVGVLGINAQLSLGSSTTEVNVTTDTPLLDTESGAQEQTLSYSTLSELPQVGADWQNFVWLQAGATGTPQNASSVVQPNVGQASVNGNLPFESVLADGATTTLPMSQNSDVTIFETTSEVKMSDAAFSAQYGIGNVVYNQISKGGTDTFHGAGYEYFQNDALNAAPYSFGQQGVKVPFLRYNNFGFNVGGPILKHKMFFFFDYDKTIQHGGASNGFITVPDPGTTQVGNFTAAGIQTLYDPTTQTIQTAGSHTYVTPQGSFTQTCPCVIRQTFASEYGTNSIPAALVDPVSAKVQALFPKANVPNPTVSGGLAINNYFYNTPGSNPFTKYFGRLDYDITSKNRLTVSETESDNPELNLNQGLCPIQCQTGDVSRDNAQVSDVWTFGPHLVNEARMGFTDQMNFFVPSTLGLGYPAQLGWKFAKADNFPNVGINGFYGLGSQSNAVYKEMVFDPSDVVTLIHGKHILHFGGEFLISRADSTAWGNIDAGDVNFDGRYTSINGLPSNSISQGVSYTSGVGYADFLLGQSNYWGATVKPEWGGRQKSPQLFVQDDIKLKPNLTVNLGLRWEGNTGWSEVKGNESSFDPTVINPADNTPGAIWYGTTKANGRNQLVAPQYNIWLPRAGFSYQMMANTVLRGAFGIYAGQLSQDTYGGGLGVFGQSGNQDDNGTTQGKCPIIQFNGVANTPDTTDPGCGVGAFNGRSINSAFLNSPTTPDAFNGQGVSYFQYHTPVPKNYQWTLSMQRQLGNNYVANVAYVGNHGAHLNFPVDINQVPQNKLGPNDNRSVPYPNFQGIGGSPNNAISNYNALQTELKKRVSYGLEFDVNYTWSHFLDDQDSSGWGSRAGYQNYQNAFNTDANYSNSNYDVRHAFKGNVIYALPFGKGKQFLNNNWLLDELIGGWQASSTFVIQTGNPFGITTGNYNNSGNQSGSYTQYANLIGNVQKSGSTKSRLGEYYNTDALTLPANYTYGDFRRNTLHGPGIAVMNGSLGKTFDLYPERGIRLTVRGEAFNVLNHASFGLPGGNAISGNPSIDEGGAAVINSVTVGGRTMQLYGKIVF